MTSNQGDFTRARWRKSSHSNGSGGNCLEVGEDFPGAAHWRKSTRSNGSGGDCVEVAVGTPQGPGTPQGIVPVRDTKTAPGGPTLAFSAAPWAHFVGALCADTLSGRRAE